MPLSTEKAREVGRKGGQARKGYRAPHTLARQKVEAMLINEASKHLPDIVVAMTEAAKGMWVEVKKNGETVRVYRKAPDVTAIREYFDRLIGKATQPIGIDTGDEEVSMTISLTGRAKELAKKYKKHAPKDSK